MRWLKRDTAIHFARLDTLCAPFDNKNVFCVSHRLITSVHPSDETRFLADAEALQLLNLLSVLPDGLSDHVLRTSLAYLFDERLKLPVPIRGFMRHLHPQLPRKSIH
jgi:hypothetical protein